MRKTSLEAYRQIKEDGTLSRLRWAVYDFLFHNGPLTTRQVHRGVSHIAKDVGIVSARLSEMTDMEIVEAVGEVFCEETGMKVTLWDVTERLPKKLEKKKTVKCRHCNGKGSVVIHEQQRLF